MQTTPTAEESELAARRVKYAQDLQRADFAFEWTDDGSRFRAGKAEVERLRTEQAAVDPNHILWNQFAHRDFFIVPKRVAA